MHFTLLAGVFLLAGLASAGPQAAPLPSNTATPSNNPTPSTAPLPSNSPVGLAGYSAAIDLGNAAISAPFDRYGVDTLISTSAVPASRLDASLCAVSCSDLNANATADGTPGCHFFNTYLLKGSNSLEQRCDLYSESWPAAFATNYGHYQGFDYLTVVSSEAYSNSTDPGLPSPAVAVDHASKAIQADTLRPFCSAFLGKVASPASATVPDTLTRYPADILSSACSLQPSASTASPFPSSTSSSSAPTSSSFSTTFTPTPTPSSSSSAIASTSSTSSSSPSTPTPSPSGKPSYCGSGQTFALGLSDGTFGVIAPLADTYPYIGFQATSLSSAQSFTLDSDCALTVVGGDYNGQSPALIFGYSTEYVRVVDSGTVGGQKVVCTIGTLNTLFCGTSDHVYSLEASANGLTNGWQLAENAPADFGTQPISIVAAGYSPPPDTTTSTTTASTPAPSPGTSTTVTTTTSTTSSTSTPPTSLPNYCGNGYRFIILSTDNNYAHITPNLDSYPYISFDNSVASYAQVFTLGEGCVLTAVGGAYDGQVPQQKTLALGDALQFFPKDDTGYQTYQPVVCTFDDNGGTDGLVCSVQGNTLNGEYTGYSFRSAWTLSLDERHSLKTFSISVTAVGV